MKIIGVTGGVGAGKSRIMSYLSEFDNSYTAEADMIAKELYFPGNPVYERLLDAFQDDDILDDKGELDKKTLAKLVFEDDDKLLTLNGIVHPAVREMILSLIEKEKSHGTEHFFLEAAMLIENGYKDICDEMWYIYASEKTRINRLMESRGYSEEKCISIIRNQKSEEYYKTNSDHVIDNDRPFEEVKRSIDKIME